MNHIFIVTYIYFSCVSTANFLLLLVCWKNPFLTPYHVIKMFSCLIHFIFLILLKHTKDMVIFNNLRTPLFLIKSIALCLAFLILTWSLRSHIEWLGPSYYGLGWHVDALLGCQWWFVDDCAFGHLSSCWSAVAEYVETSHYSNAS